MTTMTRFLLSVLLLWVGYDLALAHDGSVNITGTIQDNTCEVAPDSQSKTVEMGTINRKELTGTGDKSPAQTFSIHLQNCGPAASEAKVTFTGTPDPVNPELFALDATDDAASGLALGIYETDGTLIKPDVESAGVNLQPGQTSAVLSFKASYVSVARNVITGRANVFVSFNVHYD